MTQLESVFRAEFGAMVASLTRRFGDLSLAEDAASDAILAALEDWPHRGVPVNPGGWLMTTASRKAIDRLRREAQRGQKQALAALALDVATEDERVAGPLVDDRLRLIFTCCHPALPPEARVALTLRLVCGLSVADIARAFFSTEAAISQRITRAKSKIRDAHIPYRVPNEHEMPSRLSSVAQVIYVVFNEGYLAGDGDGPMREDLCDEAIRVARLLNGLMPHEGEVAGLLALMLLSHARKASRFSSEGELVTLAEQDRSGWDRHLIAEGHAIVRRCLAANRPGPYQFQAAINAVHTDAPSAAATDWSQIATLYDQWLAMAPSPVVALNRAVAIAEIDGPDVALGIVDGLDVVGYHAWHATRAELLRRVGRSYDARQEYSAAIAATANPGERRYLESRRSSLVDGHGGLD